MRFLTILAIALTALWGGYWFAGSRALDRAVTAGLQTLPEVAVAGHSISGFPNRFDVTFDQPRVTFRGATWASAFVQVFALSYQPNHLITVFAPDQTLDMAGQQVALRSGDLRASVVMAPSLDLPLDRFTLIGQQLALTALEANHQADTLRAATRRAEGDASGRVHDIAVVLENLIPDPAVLARFDPQNIWPRVLEELRIEGQITLSRALDRHAAQGQTPQVEDAALTRMAIAWPGVRVDATGDVRLDPQGLASGALLVRVTGWQQIVGALRAAGAIPQDQVAFVTLALQGLRTAEDDNTIEAPLSIDAGVVRLGPLTLGVLPPLR